MGWRMAHGSLEFLGASFPRAAVYFCEMIDVDSKAPRFGFGSSWISWSRSNFVWNLTLRCVLKISGIYSPLFGDFGDRERERQATFLVRFSSWFSSASQHAAETHDAPLSPGLALPMLGSVKGSRERCRGRIKKLCHVQDVLTAYKCYWLRFLLLVINC